MIKIGDIAINPNFVITVTNDKVNNRSMVKLHDNGMLTIPHSEINYNTLVDKIDWDQRNQFR